MVAKRVRDLANDTTVLLREGIGKAVFWPQTHHGFIVICSLIPRRFRWLATCTRRMPNVDCQATSVCHCQSIRESLKTCPPPHCSLLYFTTNLVADGSSVMRRSKPCLSAPHRLHLSPRDRPTEILLCQAGTQLLLRPLLCSLSPPGRALLSLDHELQGRKASPNDCEPECIT
jgi:hypothetical protein